MPEGKRENFIVKSMAILYKYGDVTYKYIFGPRLKFRYFFCWLGWCCRPLRP